MRKQQIKLIERAKKRNFIPSQIALLSREDLTIQELNTISDYFTHQQYLKKNIERELLVDEAEKCISFLKTHREKILNADDYKRLLNAYLPNWYQEDTLIGDKKKNRIFKVYKSLVKYKGFDGNRINMYMFNNYVFLLYRGISAQHINVLLRPMLTENANTMSYSWIFTSHPYLLDDYLHNGQDSIFYYIAFELGVFDYNSIFDMKTLESLYDFKEHKFCFKKDEFENYFVKQDVYGKIKYVCNTDYLTKKGLEMHPVVKLVAEFCKKMDLTPDNKEKGIFTTWKSWQLDEPEKADSLKQCYEILGQYFTVDIGSFYFSIEISSNYFVTVKYYKYKSITAGTNNDSGWVTHSGSVSAKKAFMITPDGKLFKQAAKSNKYFPLNVQDFVSYYETGNIFGDFIHQLFEFYKSRNIFYEDVITDCLETGSVMPLTFNEIAECHNRKELILGKYKRSAEMNVKWNKQNLNLSYLIIKAYSCVEPGISRRILLQQKALEPVKNGNYWGKSVYKPYKYLEHVLCDNIQKNEIKSQSPETIEKITEKYRKELADEVHTNILSDEYEKWLTERVNSELFAEQNIMRTVHDYISMCRQAKIKIRLDIRSIRQLENLHGHIATNPADYRKNTGVVNVPKKSKFLPLRDILPEEFEWITTRKRLILETELQHHCVWSYAEMITNDTCAIYSFTDTRAEYTKDGVPKRYTIEFRQDKSGTYYVVQVQGKYDRVNAYGMKEYIQSLLTAYTNQQKGA